MSVRCERNSEGLIFFVGGEIDHHGAKGILYEIDGELERNLGRCVAVDLSGVSFMDSSGIAVLLRIYRRVKEIDGRVTVRGTPEQAMKVLKAAGLQKLMKFE